MRLRTVKARYIIVSLIALSVANSLGVFLGLGFFGFPRQPNCRMEKRDKEVYVKGSRIRYREIEGNRPTVIFLHGNDLSLKDWESVMSLLPGRHLIAFDLIGYAGSDRPDLPYDLECQRQYCLGFMNALGIDEAILVGWSMGASVAAWTAAQSGERILGVVMIAPPGVPGSLYYKWPKGWLCNPGILNRFTFHIVNSKLFKWVFPLSLGRQTIGITNSYNQQYSEALYEIDQPVLLVWSPSDPTTLFAFRNVYEERIKNLEFEELPPSVLHMVPRTYAGGTALLISNFLNKIRTSRRTIIGNQLE